MSRNQIIRTVTLLLFLVFLYLVRGALFSILLGVILYYVLDPLVDLLSARRLNRDLSIVISFAVLLAFCYLALLFVIPPLVKEFGSLAANASQYFGRVKTLYLSLQARELGLHVPGEVNAFLAILVHNLADFLAGSVKQTAGSLLGVVSRVFYLVITPIVTYYLLRDDEHLFKGVIDLVPDDHKDVAVRVLSRIDDILRNYIIGQAILCSAVGVMCGVGCWLLGIRFALILGVVAGVAQLIPNIGPLVATLPAMAVALSVDPLLVFYVLLLYLAVSALTISVLAPKVLGGRLNLHPLTVVVSIVVFGELMGVWGFFFAAPIVAIIKVLYLELRNP